MLDMMIRSGQQRVGRHLTYAHSQRTPYCKTRQVAKLREAQGMLDMMIRGGQHIEPATYSAHIQSAWASGVLPLQAYAVRLFDRAVARHGLPAAAVEDDAAAAATRLSLPGSPPFVALVGLVQLLCALRARLVSGACGAGVRPLVLLEVAVQVRLGLVCACIVLWAR